MGLKQNGVFMRPPQSIYSESEVPSEEMSQSENYRFDSMQQTQIYRKVSVRSDS